MRNRSKSVFVARHEDEIDDEEEKWSKNKDVDIIKQISEQIKSSDSLPYEETLNNINWKSIFIPGHTPSEIKKHFYDNLKKQRTYRLLTEILKDMETQFATKSDLAKKSSHTSAFTLFIAKNKELIKEHISSDGDNNTFIKTASKLYKELTESEKNAYKEKSDLIRQSYKDVVNKYNLIDEAVNSKKLKTGANKITPFAAYLEDKRKTCPKVPYSATRKEYAQLEKQEKLQWILKSLGVQPGEKLNLWQYTTAKENFTKDELAILDEYEGRPQKANNRYNVFVRSFCMKYKEIPRTEVFKMASETWRKMTEEEKEKYGSNVDIKSKHKNELKEWINSLPKERRKYERLQLKSNKKNTSKAEETEHLIESDQTDVYELKPEKQAKRKVSNGNQVSKKKNTRNNKKNKDLNSQNGENESQKENENVFSPDKSVSKKRNEVPMEKKTRNNKKNKDLNSRNEGNESQKENEDVFSPDKSVSKKRNEVTMEKKTRNNKKNKDLNSQNEENELLKENEENDSRGENGNVSSPDESLSKKRKKPAVETEKLLNKKPRIAKKSINEEEQKKKQTKKMKFTLKKPPSSLFKYYVLNVYEGPMNRAKAVYKSLSKKDKAALQNTYEELNKQFLADFEKLIKTLNSKEINEIIESNNRNDDDEISDLTESDEDSDDNDEDDSD